VASLTSAFVHRQTVICGEWKASANLYHS